jgi:hypothetical protein
MMIDCRSMTSFLLHSIAESYVPYRNGEERDRDNDPKNILHE